MATIKDVAKEAHVSISTVSYAMNADPRIPEKTASMIRKVATDIGYFPNAAARNLKKRNTQTILVAIADFGGPVYHNLLDGIHYELAKSNYTMIVSTGISSENLLKERSADGAIITDIHIGDEILSKIAKNFQPIIVLDRDLPDPEIYNMTINNFQAMKTLTQDVINKGYKKIAFVNGVSDAYDNKTRHEGFLQAMGEAGLSVFGEYSGNFTTQSGRDLIQNLVQEKKPLPEMFVCANDEMAIGVMEGLKSAGYELPRDFGISGFDDIELATYVKPQLSTVRIDHFSWGRNIAATIVALLQNKQVQLHKQPGTVVVRESF